MVRIYSRLLKETIVCVEDGSAAPPTDNVVYTRSEIAALRGLEADALRSIHQVKKEFGGRYVGPSPNR